jgi:hypothetical protein
MYKTKILLDGYRILSDLVATGLINFKKTVLTVSASLDLCRLSHFSHFTKAFSHLYSINTKGANAPVACARMILVYYAFYRIHCSRFYSLMVEMRVRARLPSFVIAVLENISSETKSLNSKNLNTYGVLSNDFNLYDYLDSLKDESPDYFMNFILETPLYTAFSTFGSNKNFVRLLADTIEYYLALVQIENDPERRDVLLALKILESVDTIPLPEKVDRLVMKNFVPTTAITEHLGIYRFSNYREFGDARNMYQVNIRSVSSVASNTFQFLIVFLFLFRPQFTGHDLEKEGFQTFSFDDIDPWRVWVAYLSVEMRSRNDGPRGNGRTGKTQRTAGPALSNRNGNQPNQPLAASYSTYAYDSIDTPEKYHDSIDVIYQPEIIVVNLKPYIEKYGRGNLRNLNVKFCI